MVSICPNCQNRYSVAPHSGDYVHQCINNSLALIQEDVPVIGNWTDYTGSGNAPGAQVVLQSAGNNLQGTDAGIRGEQFNGTTDRGNNVNTNRQRQHLEYIADPKNTER